MNDFTINKVIYNLFITICLMRSLSGQRIGNTDNNEASLYTCGMSDPPSYVSNCWKWAKPPTVSNLEQVVYTQHGCDNEECEALVCSCDPYCCEMLWDLSCRGYPENRFVAGCSAHYL